MPESGKEWEYILFQGVSQVNSQIIEHLGYSLDEIITGIQPFTSVKHKIQINSLSTQLKVSLEEKIFPLMWDYMA